MAEELGIEVDDSSLHSSAYDAQVSVRSLARLVASHTGCLPEAHSMAELVDAVTEKFAADKDAYDRRMSAGYCFITSDGDRYRLKSSRNRPDDNDIIAMIHVEDRKEAMVYFSNLFLGRIIEGNLSLPKLTDRKLAMFRKYTNSYTPEGKQMASKLMQLARKYR